MIIGFPNIDEFTNGSTTLRSKHYLLKSIFLTEDETIGCLVTLTTI